MGIISAIGCSVPETLESLKSERSGIGKILHFDTIHKEFPAGEVTLGEKDLKEMLHIPQQEIATRTSLLGMVALRETLESASLTEREGLNVAFISGTTVGGMDKSEQFYLDFLTNDTHNGYIAAHDCGACTEMIADHFGGFRMVTSISTACSSAANAIIMGANLIKQGKADIVVAGGSECITKFHFNGFHTLMILDTKQCRPFDRDRQGLNLGEGAAYVVLESAASAAARKVPALCTLSGYGNACDAFHQTASSPEGEGAFRAMSQALASAGLKPSDIDYINAHGTGTPNNDLSESTAILRLFGDKVPPFSSTKQMTGHTTSASGSVEAVISVLCIKEGIIPANLGFSHPIEETGLTPLLHHTEGAEVEHVLSNSFGFGGNDSSLIFSKTGKS